MKRILCIVLIACIFPACAFAVDLSEFNSHLEFLGNEAIDETTAVVGDEFITFSAGNCKLGFKEEGNEISRVVFQGDGASFLAYALAIIMTFEEDIQSITEDAGKLLAAYLRARDGEEQYYYISSKKLFIIKQYGNEYLFTIGK